MKILIVDDSRAMQTIVRRGIEQLGYDNLELKKADNGQQALDIIRIWEPNLVLSDWHMPEMTGLELLKSLNRQMLSVTIGFVTTEASPENIQEALNCGAQFVVQKPFDFKTLHEAVLPIIQSCSDDEQTLEDQQKQQEQEQYHTSEHIILPSIEQLQERINTVAVANIECKPIKPMVLSKYHAPYLLGLYSDARQKTIHAIAITDIQGACVLAACMGNIAEESIHIILAERALPKMAIENNRTLLKAAEAVLLNDERQTHLSLRSANVMRRSNESVKKLLKKTGEERLDTAIKIPGLDPGRLTFIVS